MRNDRLLAALLGATTMLLTAPASATLVTVNAFDWGYVRSPGFSAFHQPTSPPFTGHDIFNNQPLRGFFIFNLAGLSGTVTGATFRYISAYQAADASVDVGLYDVSPFNTGVLDASVDFGGVGTAFGDLGSGVSYASVTMVKASFPTPTTPINIPLNAAALSDIATRSGAADKRFAIGSAITSPITLNAGEFCHCVFSGGATPQLILDVQQAGLFGPLGPPSGIGGGAKVSIDAGQQLGDPGSSNTTLGALHGLNAQALPGTAPQTASNTRERSFLFEAAGTAPVEVYLHGMVEGLLAADHGALASMVVTLKLFDDENHLLGQDQVSLLANPTGSQSTSINVFELLDITAMLIPGELYRIESSMTVHAQSTALGAARALFADTFEYAISGSPTNQFADPNRQTETVTQTDPPPGGQVPEPPTLLVLGMAAAGVLALRRRR
jgi:hypothetical protein